MAHVPQLLQVGHRRPEMYQPALRQRMDDMNWLYLLHFDIPLKHARHYAGATTNLEQRLEEHASGKGAAILRHLLQIGTGWKLAKLWTTEKSLPFEIERAMKSQKNGPRYCPLCGHVDRTIPGAISYPIEYLPPYFCTEVKL